MKIAFIVKDIQADHEIGDKRNAELIKCMSVEALDSLFRDVCNFGLKYNLDYMPCFGRPYDIKAALGVARNRVDIVRDGALYLPDEGERMALLKLTGCIYDVMDALQQTCDAYNCKALQ